VRPGEKLLVPMDEAGMEALAGKAQRIIERLESGEDFIDVARETSDADIIEEVIRPGDEVDLLLPEIRLALRDTQVGDISPMIRTKHGFLIFKLLMKEDEKYKPLPAVKPQLEKMMRNRAQKLSLEVFRQDLLTTPLLNIDKDLLYRTANQTFLEMDQVMATFEREDGSTFEMRFRDLVPNFTRRDEYRTAKVEDRIKMVEDAFLMDDTLYNRYAEDHGITERREVFHRVDFWERMALARFYTHHHIDEKKMESTALLYDYFNRYRKEEFYRYPIFDLRVLALEFDPNDPSSREDVVQQLTFFKDTINSEARFIELVKATSIDEQTRDEGGLAKNVQGNSLTGEIGEALEEAKPGDIVGPLQLDADNAMGIVYVVARKNEFNRPFEDIFMLVAENFKKRVRENIELELRNEIIAEAEKEGKWLYPILDLEDVEQATNLPDDTEKVEPSEADTADQ
jgi:parvulin-like peptidyl-prolyl isomerase